MGLGRVAKTRSEPGEPPPVIQSEDDPRLIQLRDVALSFGPKVILDGVSFDVKRREVVCVIGPSGAGKSTILKLIAGLLAPDKGQVIVRSDKIGMAFQYSALLSSISVFDNVALPLLKTQKHSWEEMRRRVLEKLELVGLEKEVEAFPDELSGGMRKRVSVARALAVEPDILLYDEPSAGLDPMTAAKLESDIRRISKQVGAATVIITHDLETIEHVADRILVLHKGKIPWRGSRQEFLVSQDPYPVQFRERRPEGPIEV